MANKVDSENIKDEYEDRIARLPLVKELGLSPFFHALDPKWSEVKVEQRLQLFKELIQESDLFEQIRRRIGFSDLEALDFLVPEWLSMTQKELTDDLDQSTFEGYLFAGCAYLSLAFKQKNFTFPQSAQRIQQYKDRFIYLCDGRRRKKVYTDQRNQGFQPLGSAQLNPNKHEFTSRDFKDIAADLEASARGGVDLFDVVVTYAFDYGMVEKTSSTFVRDILGIAILQLFYTRLGGKA